MDEVLLTVQIAAAEPRTEVLEGRDHLVFPAKLVQEQVLHNNLGVCFLPAEEIARTADAWNGIPIIVRHATQRGQFISARTPGVLNAVGVGRMFNAREEDGVLKADLFFDVARLEAIPEAGEMATNAKRGVIGEISTGFGVGFLDPTSGMHDGKQYECVMRAIVPDHLALLPEGEGACSVADGCGLGANVASGEVPSTRFTYDGVEEGPWTAPALIDFADAGELAAETIDELDEDGRAFVVRHTLAGNTAATTFAELARFPVVNPATHKLNLHALQALVGTEVGEAALALIAKETEMGEPTEPSTNESRWAWFKAVMNRGRELLSRNESDDDKRQMIRAALIERFGGHGKHIWIEDVFSDEGFVVFEVHSEMTSSTDGLWQSSFTISDDGEVEVGDPVEVRRVTTFEPVTAGNSLTQENRMDREQLLVHLADKGPLERVALELLTDCQLQALHTAVPEPAGNTAADGSQEPAPASSGGTPSSEPTSADSAAVATLLTQISEKLDAQGTAISQLEGVTAPAVAEQERVHTALVSELAANERVPFSEEQLKSKSVEELQMLSSMVSGRSYTGQGGPSAVHSTDPGQEFSTPTPYTASQDSED